ncbi:MAG TPA: DegV family protein [Actinomycetota bacterium]
MTVAVLTDSASALPAEVAALPGVVVVPMWVTVGDESRRDTEVPLDELFRRFDEGVTTSGPSPGDVRAAIEGVLGPDGALVVTVASRMSGSYQVARLVAEGFDGRVRVVDPRTAAGGQALVALAAAEHAAAGASLGDVEAAALRVAGRVRLLASLGSLDWLVRGGHVPEVVAWAGRSLGLRPIVEFRRGRVRPMRPARTVEAVIERIASECRKGAAPGARLRAVGMHTGDDEPARRLLDAVTRGTESSQTFLSLFNAVMVTHTGPDLFGLAWWWEERA